MKKYLISIIGLAALLPAASFAASAVLKNGGLGQVASNQTQFGVAVCNGGSVGISQSVPVSVSTNGETATVSSVAPIASGACEYSYVPYGQLGMQAGQTYSVVVTIDPAKTLVAKSDEATYSVTVPGGQAAVNPQTGTSANTADVNAQSENIFAIFWHWLTSLF